MNLLFCFVEQASLGGLGDSFYEYLIKSWVLSGKKDEQARSMYENAMKVCFSLILNLILLNILY